jgi:hypothetical protein
MKLKQCVHVQAAPARLTPFLLPSARLSSASSATAPSHTAASPSHLRSFPSLSQAPRCSPPFRPRSCKPSTSTRSRAALRLRSLPLPWPPPLCRTLTETLWRWRSGTRASLSTTASCPSAGTRRAHACLACTAVHLLKHLFINCILSVPINSLPSYHVLRYISAYCRCLLHAPSTSTWRYMLVVVHASKAMSSFLDSRSSSPLPSELLRGICGHILFIALCIYVSGLDEQVRIKTEREGECHVTGWHV